MAGSHGAVPSILIGKFLLTFITDCFVSKGTGRSDGHLLAYMRLCLLKAVVASAVSLCREML